MWCWYSIYRLSTFLYWWLLIWCWRFHLFGFFNLQNIWILRGPLFCLQAWFYQLDLLLIQPQLNEEGDLLERFQGVLKLSKLIHLWTTNTHILGKGRFLLDLWEESIYWSWRRILQSNRSHLNKLSCFLSLWFHSNGHSL